MSSTPNENHVLFHTHLEAQLWPRLMHLRSHGWGVLSGHASSSTSRYLGAQVNHQRKHAGKQVQKTYRRAGMMHAPQPRWIQLVTPEHVAVVLVVGLILHRMEAGGHDQLVFLVALGLSLRCMEA